MAKIAMVCTVPYPVCTYFYYMLEFGVGTGCYPHWQGCPLSAPYFPRPPSPWLTLQNLWLAVVMCFLSYRIHTAPYQSNYRFCWDHLWPTVLLSRPSISKVCLPQEEQKWSFLMVRDPNEIGNIQAHWPPKSALSFCHTVCYNYVKWILESSSLLIMLILIV